jgi:pimeloyl-ACP methyl ester carboxylesterase
MYSDRVRVDDINVAYRVFGEGHPLLLIMGYASTMDLWELALINSLASRYQVIIFDNRGMGDSELVLNYPLKVSKLILYATYANAELFPPNPEVIQRLTDMSGTPQERGMRFISALFPDSWLQANSERVREIFFRPMGSISEESTRQQAMAISSWGGSVDRLNKISHPVLLISGVEDALVPAQNSCFVRDHISTAQLELIAHSGHGLMFQYPDVFCEKIVNFLG